MLSIWENKNKQTNKQTVNSHVFLCEKLYKFEVKRSEFTF